MYKLILFLVLSIFGLSTFAQKPTIETVDKLIYKALEMDESKKDSLPILANQIKKDGKTIGYHLGEIYYDRFMGWYEEYAGNYDKSIGHYLNFLNEARNNNYKSEELQALTDLGSIYLNTNQLDAARNVFTQGFLKTDSLENPKRKSAFYNNLGIVYKKKGELDSALIMYTKSMRIKELLGDSLAIANLKINTAALLISLGRYDEAEKQVQENIDFTEKKNRFADLWHNLTNLSDIKIRKKQFNQALDAANRSLAIAEKLESKQRKAESILALSIIYEGLENFEKALDFQRKAYNLKEEYINEQSNDQINQLREEFNAEQRERENILLNDKLGAEEQKQIFFWAGIALLAILLGVIGFALNKNRKKNAVLIHQNELINLQKDKLTELNEEKNSLISIVSHDLRSPFNAISMWNKTLADNLNKSPLKVAESVEAIEKMAVYGQNLINDILDIEQMEINNHQVDLQNFDIIDFCKELIADFAPAANGKDITIKFENNAQSTQILSDQKLLRRALENLISNALKFSHRSSEILVNVMNENDKTIIAVRDHGVGIAKDEQAKIFSKYGQTSTKPTEGENSTGLGLSIVKRIMEELGGKVSFESSLGKGTTFRLEV
ncbi:His Kinase A (phospho-acceptor) domain-containing protein [Spirosomataceae bacterium TFI 002]|nr:His Kinase A (phospho-acceptor) domain-containing protein [Spirosomataceae bacterium TFI 002]